ncbi:MAG: DUF4118 domain-containing protein [Saprospiraceae bacterium]|nr:DUF4118 domain-containing protein [Pyrinomonadaceae bacterium]
MAAFAGVTIVTLALIPLRDRTNTTAVALALLLVVLVVATLFGSRTAFFASLLGVFSFNFFFLPPLYTLTIADPQNWVALAAFLITSIIAGQLSSYARRRAAESDRQRGEIERLYEDLQDAFEKASEAEALRRSDKLKSSLLDAVTHDLRTPLTSIKASATTLLDNKKERFLDDEAEVEFLEIIDEESDRLNDFIEGMVGLAKIEANALHLRKNWNSIHEVINAAIGRAKNQLETFYISIEIERDLPAIFIDAASIAEVLYLLLVNAAKYSSRGSKIKISAHQIQEDRVEISVRDQGRGIPGELREKVFEKFYRATENQVPTTDGGLGLGLAIAKGIVESQGGRIWIEDGKGEFVTRFVISLPIGDEGN